MEESKGVAMAILGIVAVISVVGLVLLFNGATANVVTGGAKVYGGGEIGRGLNEQTSGIQRYIDETRLLEFEEGYDPYHPRLRDSGNRNAPYAVVSSPHREWSDQGDDPCPFRSHPSLRSALYAEEGCVPVGVNPANGEEVDVGPTNEAGKYCCPSYNT